MITRPRYAIAMLALSLPGPVLAQDLAQPAAGGDVQDDIVVIADADRTQIDRKAYRIVDSPLAQTLSAGDILHHVPLVRVTPEGQISLAGVPGVRVLIDGKDFPNVNSYIRALPAARIERVEVLTNPSGEFGSDGSTGIINIVLKRRFADGLSGATTATVDRFGGVEFRVGPVWSNNKWTLTSLVAGSDVVAPLYQIRSLSPTNGPAQLLEERNGNNFSRSVTGSGSVARRLEGEASLQLTLFGTSSDGKIEQDNRLPLGPNNAVTTIGMSLGVIDLSAYSASLSYQDSSGPLGGNLSASLTYGVTDLNSALATKSGGPIVIASSTGFHQSRLNFDLSSKFKLNEDILSIGVQVENVETTGSSEFTYFGVAAPIIFASSTKSFGNVSKYDAFATYQFKILDLSILPSARLEARDYNFETGVTRSRSSTYLRIAPSLHLELPATRRLAAKFSYSRAYTYPAISDLDPALQLSGPLSGQRGNPQLRPQTTQTFEIGGDWSLAPHQVSILLSRRVIEDVWLTQQAVENGAIVVSQQRNFGQRHSSSVTLEASGTLLGPLKYELSGSCSRILYREGGAAELSVSECLASGAIKYQERDFNSPHGDMLDFRLDWTSASNDPLMRVAAYWSADLTWAHRFTRRISSSLQISDIFDTSNRRVSYETIEGRIDQFGGSDAPRVKFSLTYQLGSP